MTEQIEVVFQPSGRRRMADPGENVLDVARSIGVDLASVCGGKGTCGKCRVAVISGGEKLNELTEYELKKMTDRDIEKDYRFACQILVPTDALLDAKSGHKRLVLKVPEESKTGEQRLQTEGREVPIEIDPIVKKYYFEVKKATLHDLVSDELRMLAELEKKYGLKDLVLTIEAAYQLPAAIRGAKTEDDMWTATAVVWNDQEIIAIEPGDTRDQFYGFAVDIGSTKVAGFLLDLNTGEVKSLAAIMNPQIPYGEDIMSRITYTMQRGEEAQETLHKVIVEGVNEICQKACDQAGINPELIYDWSLVGNTAMSHLFLKVLAKYVALAPYPPAVSRGINIRLKDFGMLGHPNAKAYFSSCIGGFVGADNVAVVLASDLGVSDELILALDIGTNTEIDLGSKELGAMCCSTASGPAFEGMQIAHGMRAATGAIERISVDPFTQEVDYKTIGDAPPVGICGSALVEAPSEFLKAGIMNFKGKIDKELLGKHKHVKQGEKGLEFIIAFKEEAGIDTDIWISQNDIRQLQLAKAAMHTGCTVLLHRMNVTEEDLDAIVVAGAFGNFIQPEAARTVGMYPETPLEKIRLVGNAAGTGARMNLVSRECRQRSENIPVIVKYHELAVDPMFLSEYANSMMFPYSDLSRYPETSELLLKAGRITEDQYNKFMEEREKRAIVFDSRVDTQIAYEKGEKKD